MQLVVVVVKSSEIIMGATLPSMNHLVFDSFPSGDGGGEIIKSCKGFMKTFRICSSFPAAAVVAAAEIMR